MTLYDIIVTYAQEPYKIKHGSYLKDLQIDLANRNVTSNKVELVKNGKLMVSKLEFTNGQEISIDGLISAPSEVFYDKVEELYHDYYYSVPKINYNKTKINFIACNVDTLSASQLLHGMDRQLAQLLLETFIVLMASNSTLEWANDKHFYWQSQTQKGLILYKNWVK